MTAIATPPAGRRLNALTERPLHGSHCDVCGTNGAVRLGASRLGPASFNYCQSCIDHKAELFMMVASRIFVSGGLNSGPFDELKDVVTFVDGRYVGLDVVLERYSDVEGEIRAAFSS